MHLAVCGNRFEFCKVFGLDQIPLTQRFGFTNDQVRMPMAIHHFTRLKRNEIGLGINAVKAHCESGRKCFGVAGRAEVLQNIDGQQRGV